MPPLPLTVAYLQNSTSRNWCFSMALSKLSFVKTMTFSSCLNSSALMKTAQSATNKTSIVFMLQTLVTQTVQAQSPRFLFTDFQRGKGESHSAHALISQASSRVVFLLAEKPAMWPLNDPETTKWGQSGLHLGKIYKDPQNQGADPRPVDWVVGLGPTFTVAILVRVLSRG